MQVAARNPLWNVGHTGTEVEINMTPTTGLEIKFLLRSIRDEPAKVDWGDGTKEDITAWCTDFHIPHTYRSYGKYKVVFEHVSGVGFRPLDGWPQYSYDNAVISVVDFSGEISQAPSGAFKYATNLERFVAPACTWVGQRPFSGCTKLKEVVLGKVGIHYDGSFENCTSLESYTTVTTGTCWSYIFRGCTKITELRLGTVSQFATEDFKNTPNLMDIWIDGKTVEQIKQVAPTGNIASGYGAKFPWNANPTCRFHGTNGIVLGNGTIIHE